MFKKILAGVVLSMGLLGMTTTVEATSTGAKPALKQEVKQDIAKNIKAYQITHPDKEFSSKDDKIALINGKAPANTEIKITVYGTTDLTRKNFNLDKLPSEKDYIEISSETIKAGNTGFFQKQMDLVMGVNKIVISFEVEGVDAKEYIIYVYDKAPTLNEIISVIR